jgi:hypothetical protein
MMVRNACQNYKALPPLIRSQLCLGRGVSAGTIGPQVVELPRALRCEATPSNVTAEPL